MARASSEGVFHGGAFSDALDPTFPPGYASRDIVIADVLDAWFPPAPGVVEALREEAARLARTSPPIHAEGVREVLAERRDLPLDAIVTGAGSSDLIYRALPAWLNEDSRVLLIEPTYGEYAHLIERVIGARVDRFWAADGFDPDRWEATILGGGYDLAVLVNPNNPTGEIVSPERIVRVASRTRTRILVDEAYMDYLDPALSVQREAAEMSNLTVVRSLSKGLALSGLRTAHLIAEPDEAARLRRLTPPWNLSGPAQIATIRALEDPEYYAARYAETHDLRLRLTMSLRGRGYEVREGINWVMVRVRNASAFVERATERGLFVRNAGRTAPSYGDDWVRVAVLSEADQDRLLARWADA